jgi:peptidoglycan/LPS O-acetylase OafA/YrhL
MPGEDISMPAEEEGQLIVEGPSPAERRAFRLLPPVWIVVLILAGVILYGVFS